MSRHVSPDWPYKLGVALLTLMTLLVITVRPVARPSGQLFRPLGVSRNWLSESVDRDDGPLQPPTAQHVPAVASALMTVLLTVLKVRRTAFRSVPVRRFKRPPHRVIPDSPSSD